MKCQFWDCNFSTKTCQNKSDQSYTHTANLVQVFPAGQNKVAFVQASSKILIFSTQAKLIERTLTTSDAMQASAISSFLYNNIYIYIGYANGQVDKVHDKTKTTLFTNLSLKPSLNLYTNSNSLISISQDQIQIWNLGTNVSDKIINKADHGTNYVYAKSCLSYDGTQLYLLKSLNKLNIHNLNTYSFVNEVNLNSIEATTFLQFFAINKNLVVGTTLAKIYIINLTGPSQVKLITIVADTGNNFSKAKFFNQEPFFPLIIWNATKIVYFDIFAEYCTTAGQTYNPKVDGSGECLACHQSCLHCNGADQYSCTSCNTSTGEFRTDDIYNTNTCPCEDNYGNHKTITTKSCQKCDDVLAGSSFVKPKIDITDINDSCIHCQYDRLDPTGPGTKCIKCLGRRDPDDNCNCPVNTLNDGTHTCKCIDNQHIESFNKYGKFIGCNCQQGQFSDTSNGRICTNCIAGCAECDNNTTCKACTKNFFLKNNLTCSCNPTFEISSSDCVCVANSTLSGSKCECNANYFYDAFNNKCVSTCQTGYYAQTQLKVCKICPVDCVECRGFYDCQKCTNNKLLSDLQCKNSCIEGQVEINKICQTCPPFCRKCRTTKKCDICKDGKIVSELDGQCVSNCKPTLFKKINKLGNLECLPCGENCDQCESFEKCQVCSKDWFLQGEKCVQKCEKGKSPDKNNKICAPCGFTSEYEMCGGLISGELQLSVKESNVFYFIFNRKVQFEKGLTFDQYFDILIEDFSKEEYEILFASLNDQVVKFQIKRKDNLKWFHETRVHLRIKNVERISGLEDSELFVTYDLYTIGKKITLNPYWDDEIKSYLATFQLLELFYLVLNILVVVLYCANLAKSGIFFFMYTQLIGTMIYLDQYMPFTTVACLKGFSMFSQLSIWPSPGHSNQYTHLFKNQNYFNGQFYFGTQSIFQDLFSREYQRLNNNVFYFFNGISFSYYITSS